MSTHLAEADRLPLDAVGAAAPPVEPLYDALQTEEDDRLNAARGIISGLIISSPLWALIGFTVYMLL